MDLSKGAKRLTNRKRAIPVSKERKVVVPQVVPNDLSTPVFGYAADPGEIDLQKEFNKPAGDDMFGIPVTAKEKDIITAKSLQIRRQLPVLEITDIKYTIMSHEELEKMAVFEVKNKDDSGLKSVNDPRSGIVDSHVTCVTCLKDNLECPGHLGIIRLNEYIIHPITRKEVLYVLQSVCGSCGSLLLPYETINELKITNLTGSARLKELAKASEKVPCRKNLAEKEKEKGVTACIPNPVYKIQDGKIYYTRDEKSKAYNLLSVKEIEAILDSISPEDAKIMGFLGESHPRRFIMKSVAVIPLCARAPVIQDGAIWKDDLTVMYQDIVRINNELAKDLKEAEREKYIDNLIFAIEHLINNSDQKYRQLKKKPYQSLQDRIQGKEGLIRDALMGKRVNFSARTVIGPDPTLKFGQLRVPRVMAPYLTQHEIVSPENIKKMSYLLRNGKITHISPSGGRMAGRRVKVTEKHRKEHALVLGDEVDRWLSDGDYVVFNRQPTLHKQGMMGYEVVLGDPLTIGLGLWATRAHNADFDGDEGANFIPQNEDARREVAGLLSITCNIMNAQTNNNIAGVVFDALVGSYLLSLPETQVAKDVFMNIIVFLEDASSIPTLNTRLDKYSIPRYSGRALLSALFPIDFYYQKDETTIREGILISGTLDSSNIGSASGSIIQALYKDYGQKRTVDFLTDIYKMAGSYMDSHGFSVGIDDCFLTGKEPQKTIEYEVQRASMLVKAMGTKLNDPLEEERRERQIKAYLDTAKNLGSKISKENMKADNSFNVMAKSGAKGSVTNIAQITGILGQQFLHGQRMPESISGGTRSLPYFPENELDPSARGFISNSYLTGLTPSEFFFALTAARVGVSESSTSISSVGHLHHKMVKSLEDIRVVNDGSVRNSTDIIFQFAYAEDGFDASLLEAVKTKSGNFTSFVNIRRVAGKINQKYGF